jgi:orotidine-5'-phosphate decarboxylase
MTRLRNREARQKPGCTALGASEFESGNGATTLDRGLDDRERAAGRVARATAASRRVRLAPPMTLVSLVFSTPGIRAASGRSGLGQFPTHAPQQATPCYPVSGREIVSAVNNGSSFMTAS